MLENQIYETSEEKIKDLENEVVRLKKQEKILQEEKTKFRTIFENANDEIVLLDANGVVMDINYKVEEIFGYKREEVIGRNFAQFDFLSTEDLIRTLDLFDELLNGRPGKLLELDFFRKDGSVVFIEVNPKLVKNKNQTQSILAIIRDVTERKQAEEHIQELTQQIIKAQEAERQRISRDLHDNMAQDLSSLKITCETLFDHYPDISDELKSKVSEMSKILTRSITSVRDLTYNLQPPSLDQLGLVQAVYQHCIDFSDRTGIHTDFFSAGMDDIKFDFDTEINLYRIIQEALNNVRKHAHATHVRVRLLASYPSIILKIEDNGLGFCVEGRITKAAIEKRIGLKSMKERACLLQGEFKIQSLKNMGTEVYVEVPYKER